MEAATSDPVGNPISDHDLERMLNTIFGKDVKNMEQSVSKLKGKDELRHDERQVARREDELRLLKLLLRVGAPIQSRDIPLALFEINSDNVVKPNELAATVIRVRESILQTGVVLSDEQLEVGAELAREFGTKKYSGSDDLQCLANLTPAQIQLYIEMSHKGFGWGYRGLKGNEKYIQFLFKELDPEQARAFGGDCLYRTLSNFFDREPYEEKVKAQHSRMLALIKRFSPKQIQLIIKGNSHVFTNGTEELLTAFLEAVPEVLEKVTDAEWKQFDSINPKKMTSEKLKQFFDRVRLRSERFAEFEF